MGGELSTFHMGDLVDEFGSQYSELLISDYWYAAQVEGKESYCLLSLYYPGKISSLIYLFGDNTKVGYIN